MQANNEPLGGAGAGKLVIRLGALTDVGQVSEQNEDNFQVCPNLASGNWVLVPAPFELDQSGALLIVADGMGGENAGEVASTHAVEAIRSFFSKTPAAPTSHPEEVEKALVNAILFAHG